MGHSLSLCGGGGLLLAAFAVLTAGISCGSRRETAVYRHTDSVAVQMRTLDHVGTAERTRDYVRELVVLEMDTAGNLRPTKRVIETLHDEQNEKTAENTQKLDSSAFSSENDIITLQQNENGSEAKKTRFWRIAFFIVFGLAATAIAVVLLWRKTLGKWI